MLTEYITEGSSRLTAAGGNKLVTVWSLQHSKLAIFSMERKERVWNAGFVLILKIDLAEFPYQQNIWKESYT